LTIATAARFSSNPITVGRAPLLGEHNRSVLRELLGLGDAELDRLHASGVLFEDDTVAHLDVVPWR
jgi:crotonobetainyl-CoA:carnitine CoA-transferase CaiB-like acyl-CoA transferase